MGLYTFYKWNYKYTYNWYTKVPQLQKNAEKEKETPEPNRTYNMHAILHDFPFNKCDWNSDTSLLASFWGLRVTLYTSPHKLHG